MDYDDMIFQNTFEAIYEHIDYILEQRKDIKHALSPCSNNLTKYFLYHDKSEKIAIAKSLTALIILENNLFTS